MSDSLIREDLKDTKFVTVVGGASVAMPNGMQCLAEHPVAWCTLVPLEETEDDKKLRHEGKTPWPREKHFRILHEMLVGTYDQLVDDYRRKLAASLNGYFSRDEKGVITVLGTTDTKAHDAIMEKLLVGVEKAGGGGLPNRRGNPEVRAIGTSAKQVLDSRDKTRCDLLGVPSRQDGHLRDHLMRLVGSFRSGRFFHESLAHVDVIDTLPTDSPEITQKLIDALVVFKEDTEARRAAVGQSNA